MFRLLIDTCVWFDLAKDARQHAVLGVLEEMVKLELVSLIVPEVVRAEFKRNRERIAKDSAKSLAGHVKVVRDAIEANAQGRHVKSVLARLDDADYMAPIKGGLAVATLDRIEKLLDTASIVNPSPGAKDRALERALSGKAPFHSGRNSMADAIIIETYGDCVTEGKPGTRFAFVTHNKKDFGNPDHFKQAHPDFNLFFSRIRSLFFNNLVEALRRVNPTFVTEAMFEYSGGDDARALHEILDAHDLLMHQVWYNRHQNRRTEIEEGKIKLVDRPPRGKFKYKQDEILRDVWQGALRAQKEVEKKYGKENLGPWTDFEWGMVNGKLSALRWVLGEEWDMLDT